MNLDIAVRHLEDFITGKQMIIMFRKWWEVVVKQKLGQHHVKEQQNKTIGHFKLRFGYC